MERERVIRFRKDSGCYEVLSKAKQSHDDGLREHYEKEERVKQAYLSTLATEGIEPSHADWHTFLTKLLIPTLSSNNSAALELCVTGKFTLHDQDCWEHFVSNYKESEQSNIRNAVSIFLLSNDSDFLSYLSSLSHAAFVFQASGLSQESLTSILENIKRTPAFYIYLDTNVVLAALGLSLNPSSSAAKALLALKRAVAGQIDMKLFVSGSTLQEVRNHISWLLQNTKPGLITPKLAKIILREDSSDFHKIIAQRVIASKNSLNAAQVLKPYKSDLSLILKERGISIVSMNCDKISKSQFCTR